MAARGLVALTVTVLAALLTPLGLNLLSAAQVAAKITTSTGFTIENNTKLLNLLPADAKPLEVAARVLQGAAAEALAARLGTGRLLAVQEFQLPGGEKLYAVMLPGNGLRLRLYSAQGEPVKYKLVVLHNVSATEHMEEASGAGLGVSRLSPLLGPAGAAYEAATIYRDVRAVKGFIAASYLLEAEVKGRYIPLGYYITLAEYYAFYLAGHMVYKVVAKGMFYVNPGKSATLVYDLSYYTTSFPFYSCNFHTTVRNTGIAVSLRAEGTAAAADCPVTTRLHAWALVGIDKYGNVMRDGHGNKEIAIACGCTPWSP